MDRVGKAKSKFLVDKLTFAGDERSENCSARVMSSNALRLLSNIDVDDTFSNDEKPIRLLIVNKGDSRVRFRIYRQRSRSW